MAGRHKQPDGIPKKKILSFCMDGTVAEKVRQKCMTDNIKLSNLLEKYLTRWVGKDGQ
jgi:hypothetical protein